jgi:hypothetical protein
LGGQVHDEEYCAFSHLPLTGHGKYIQQDGHSDHLLSACLESFT